jgi:hypothetical protein
MSKDDWFGYDERNEQDAANNEREQMAAWAFDEAVKAGTDPEALEIIRHELGLGARYQPRP